MIQIDDNDMPIQVAEKIINGTIEIKADDTDVYDRLLHNMFGGSDMFDLEEIKEMAGYLMVYYNSHSQGD